MHKKSGKEEKTIRTRIFQRPIITIHFSRINQAHNNNQPNIRWNTRPSPGLANSVATVVPCLERPCYSILLQQQPILPQQPMRPGSRHGDDNVAPNMRPPGQFYQAISRPVLQQQQRRHSPPNSPPLPQTPMPIWLHSTPSGTCNNGTIF